MISSLSWECLLTSVARRVVSDVWDLAVGPNDVGGCAGAVTDVRGLALVGRLSNICGLTE